VANFHWLLLSAGHTIQFNIWQNSGYNIAFDNGFWDIVFIPVADYPN
jgi:hypothetical protein